MRIRPRERAKVLYFVTKTRYRKSGDASPLNPTRLDQMQTPALETPGQDPPRGVHGQQTPGEVIEPFAAEPTGGEKLMRAHVP